MLVLFSSVAFGNSCAVCIWFISFVLFRCLVIAMAKLDFSVSYDYDTGKICCPLMVSFWTLASANVGAFCLRSKALVLFRYLVSGVGKYDFS